MGVARSRERHRRSLPRRVWIGAGVIALVTALLLPACDTLRPDVASLRDTPPTRSRYMRLRARARGLDEQAYAVDWVPLEQIAPVLVCAVVKAEDGGFFRHRGVDWAQLERAASRALTGGPRMGGSTITQQLARNLYLDASPSLLRKAREVLLARRMERTLSKPRILELYLNVVEWGDGIWGIKPASVHYFGKAPADLDLFEAVFLASLLAAPRRALAGENLGRAWLLEVRVLHQLYFAGLIDAVEWRTGVTRATALRNQLATGRPLPAALAQSLGAPTGHVMPMPPRHDDTRLPWERAFAEECGLAREHDENERARERATAEQRSFGR